MYSDLEPRHIRWIEDQKTTFYVHDYAILYQDFLSNPTLMSLFEVTSTTIDDHNREFVSGYQGRQLPIYAVQYHPEKSIFSHYKFMNALNDYLTIEFCQKLSNFFV